MKARVGVVGVGRMGTLHLQKLLTRLDVDVVGVYDTNSQHVESVCAKYSVKGFQDLDTLLLESDALVVATTTVSHYRIARRALEQRIHVLVEKPLTGNVDMSLGLMRLADANRCLLQVGFLERYRVESLLSAVSYPSPRWFLAARRTPTAGRDPNVDVCTDLMVHDIDLVLSLKKAMPISVYARGSVLSTTSWDTVVAQLEFADGSLATLQASRISASPTRQISFGAEDCVVELDLGSNSGVLRQASSVQRLEHASTGFDALQVQIDRFIESIALRESSRACFGREAVDTERCLQQILDKLTPALGASTRAQELLAEHR